MIHQCGVSFTWQIAALAARDSEDDTGAADEEAAAAIAQTAQQMLLQLATDPRHGLADPQYDGAAAEPAGQQSSGLHHWHPLSLLQCCRPESAKRNGASLRSTHTGLAHGMITLCS